MLKVLEAIAITGERASLLRVAEELNAAGRDKDEYESSLDVLEALIRDAWMLSLGVEEEQIINDDLRAYLARLGASINSARAARWISQIEELREQLVVNINRKVATDALFLAMAS